MTFQELISKYPKIFEPICPSSWELPEGWVSLVGNMCDYLQYKIDKCKHSKSYQKQFRCIQMKEKFGGLRFYIDQGTEEQYNIIQYVENCSYYYCQDCGTHKNIGYTDQWIMTLCEDCSKKECYIKYNWKPKQ